MDRDGIWRTEGRVKESELVLATAEFRDIFYSPLLSLPQLHLLSGDGSPTQWRIRWLTDVIDTPAFNTFLLAWYLEERLHEGQARFIRWLNEIPEPLRVGKLWFSKEGVAFKRWMLGKPFLVPWAAYERHEMRLGHLRIYYRDDSFHETHHQFSDDFAQGYGNEITWLPIFEELKAKGLIGQ